MMVTPIQLVEGFSRVYNNKSGAKINADRPKKASSSRRHIDEVNISIEGKRRQVLEEIVSEALDGLSTKTFEK